MARKLELLVRQFKSLRDHERYELLSDLLAEYTEDPKELAFRAELCTALEQARVYPREKPATADAE